MSLCGDSAEARSRPAGHWSAALAMVTAMHRAHGLFTLASGPRPPVPGPEFHAAQSYERR